MDRLWGTDEWPEDAEDKYERIEVLGKGSFGMVWMAQRRTKAQDEFDDEFVAIKTINIKNEKSSVYAEREISILQELRHPNVIRLIHSYPVHDKSRLVVMQLARGPNLHQLIVQRGALGLPLARLVARQLISAVSYLHGRAVIHRDIKPSNCILAKNLLPAIDEYDWYRDDLIWSNGPEAQAAVDRKEWKLMLVDFGFARALEQGEVTGTNKHLRNSIVFEKQPPAEKTPSPAAPAIPETVEEGGTEREDDDDDGGSINSSDMAKLEQMAEQAATDMRRQSFEATNLDEDAIMGGASPARKRMSGVSMSIKAVTDKVSRRTSTARQHVRSMSALGTKAYAAPEIRKKLRQKTDADFEKANAAMTECVADYGMIVDAYSVGWTLRVAFTGVPPNFTLSEYLRERENAVMEGEDDEVAQSDGWCCMKGAARPNIKVRDPSRIPADATLLISKMTEKDPEKRMTVREAQHNPYIAGGQGDDKPYKFPQGDYPSKHGDPVVPLKCADKLSKLTVEYHTT